MSSVDLTSILKDLNCRSNFNIQNVTEYMLPHTKEAFYVHQQSQRTRLIIRPAFEIFSAELCLIDGVHSEYEYYHNNQMTRFPKRQHKGVEPVHYGLAFSFDDAKALSSFIEKLISIVNG
ncbi:hypothetical protein [Shewanella sp.]|uniref:hypothetical protein n=1 Tax=Shewanella sp. TaxID=50422 RepID=UPI004053D0AC